MSKVLQGLAARSNGDVTCLPLPPALFVLLAMAIYTGVTVNFLGKRFGDWRFSWSYILGWVALLMTFFAGLCKIYKRGKKCVDSNS